MSLNIKPTPAPNFKPNAGGGGDNPEYYEIAKTKWGAEVAEPISLH